MHYIAQFSPRACKSAREEKLRCGICSTECAYVCEMRTKIAVSRKETGIYAFIRADRLLLLLLRSISQLLTRPLHPFCALGFLLAVLQDNSNGRSRKKICLLFIEYHALSIDFLICPRRFFR